MNNYLNNKQFYNYQNKHMKKEIAAAIKKTRLEEKLTQTELANRIEVKQSVIALWESGRSNLSIFTIEKIFKAMNRSTSFNVSNGKTIQSNEQTKK